MKKLVLLGVFVTCLLAIHANAQVLKSTDVLDDVKKTNAVQLNGLITDVKLEVANSKNINPLQTSKDLYQNDVEKNVIPSIQQKSVSSYSSAETCTVTGRITSLDQIMSYRLIRNSVPSTCGTPKPYPGPFNSVGTYYYDTYYVANTTNSSQCVIVKASTTDPAVNVHVSAYANTFDPTNLATNYLGDIGSSATLGTPTSFSVDVPSGTILVLMMNAPSSGNVMTQDYTLEISGLPCPASCSFVGKITNTDLALKNRILRDGSPSVCGVADVYPSSVSGVFYYDMHYLTNTTGFAQCVNINAKISDPTEYVHVSVYLNSFDTTNLATNYLGDLGSSAGLTSSTHCDVNVPSGATIVLVVTDPTSGNVMTQNYTITATGIPCRSNCTYNNRIRNSSPIISKRLYRDGVTSICGATKNFPGEVGGFFYYDMYTVANNNGTSACANVNVSTTDPTEHVFVSAYLNSFDPLHLDSNYIGDIGISAQNGIPKEFNVNVPNGDVLVLVMTNPNSGVAMSQDYTLSITGMQCSVVGIVENTKENKDVIIYPNPTKDVLIVKGIDIHKGTIFTVDGKSIDVKISNNEIITVDLISGVYFLQLIDRNGNVLTKKFIKE